MGFLTLEIMTPDSSITKNRLEYASFFTSMGSVGILPSHAPFMAELKNNIPIKYMQGGKVGYISVSGGFVKVFSDKIEIVCDSVQETGGGS